MSKQRTEDLINKYVAGESSLAEEEALFNSGQPAPGMDEWSRFVKGQKQEVPPQLQETIWTSIQTRKRNRQRFLWGLSGIAASIALLIAFFIGNPDNDQLSDAEKQAALYEALSMFSEDQNTPEQQSIIYEDELIIIYTASN